MKDITKRLREKVKDIVGAIQFNKWRIEFLERVTEGKGDFNAFAISEAKQSLPKVIEEGRGLKEEYQKLTGKRLYSLSSLIKKYWPSHYD